MRPLPLILIALTTLWLGCTREEPVAVTVEPAPAAKTSPQDEGQAKKATTAVQGAVLIEQGFDRDGDGKLDRWDRLENGKLVRSTDLDGDGKPDKVKTLKTVDGMPAGFGNGEQPKLEPTEAPPAEEPKKKGK